MTQETGMQARGAVPYLTVRDGDAAIEFYKRAFGATELSRAPAPDGKKLMHAAVEINGGIVMLSDDFPEFSGGQANTPEAFGGSPVTIHLQLDDVDPVWRRAVEAGATVSQPLEDQFWGDRYGQLQDPFGHAWALGQHVEDVPPDEMRRRAEAAFSQMKR